MYNLYSNSHLSKLRNEATIEYTKNKIIILSGDPNSINSEIIYKCWKKLPSEIKRKIYFISNYKLLKTIRQIRLFFKNKKNRKHI